MYAAVVATVQTQAHAQSHFQFTTEGPDMYSYEFAVETIFSHRTIHTPTCNIRIHMHAQMHTLRHTGAHARTHTYTHASSHT